MTSWETCPVRAEAGKGGWEPEGCGGKEAKDAGDIIGGVIIGVATGSALAMERGLGGNESLSGRLISGVIARNDTSELLSG